jgi:hypothetical protein
MTIEEIDAMRSRLTGPDFDSCSANRERGRGACSVISPAARPGGQQRSKSLAGKDGR